MGADDIMTDASDLARAARELAAAGWEILPTAWPVGTRCSCLDPECPSPGKHPLTRNGKDDATSEPDMIAAWWDRWPRANIGVRPPEGVVILDVDPRNGGDVALAAAERAAGETLPATLTAETGSGGWHLWFRCGLPARARLTLGVDVKTHTGYVLVPPSRHVSGQRYRWHHSVAPVDLPRWAMGRVERRHVSGRRNTPVATTAGQSGGRELLRTMASAPEGRRNHLLYWTARIVHEEYGGSPELLAELYGTALARGLTNREIMTTLRSAAR